MNFKYQEYVPNYDRCAEAVWHRVDLQNDSKREWENRKLGRTGPMTQKTRSTNLCPFCCGIDYRALQKHQIHSDHPSHYEKDLPPLQMPRIPVPNLWNCNWRAAWIPLTFLHPLPAP